MSISEDLKRIKSLHESGAISNEEFEQLKNEILRKQLANDGVKSAMEPSAFKKFFSKHKIKLIAILALIAASIVVWWYLRPDPKDEAIILAKNYCSCQEKNNLAYIDRLETFLTDFDSKDYKYTVDVEKSLEQLNSEYLINTLTPEITTCYKEYNLLFGKKNEEYKKNTSSGKDFWFAFQSEVTKNTSIEFQTKQINNLLDSINKKLSSLAYSDPEEFDSRKETILSRMSSFYSDQANGYLDAYNYFAYKTERYFGRKNITPTEINNIIKSESDFTEPSFKLISETLELKSKENDLETWVYAIEFQAYRPSKEKYQVSNVWYEVKFNSSDKIVSYKEIKVENTKYFEPETYNTMNGNNYEEENNDW